MNERILKILNENDVEKLKETKVLVVGIGGVGGFVVETLVRSGIGKIVIIDADIIETSNLNRQIIALNSTLNQSKVEVAKERILDINPECQVTTLKAFLTKDNIEDIFKKNPVDYVIDACDTITTKLEIIKYCLKNKIEFISCMGTGNRLNPQFLEIKDLKKTCNDPLAKVMRKLVKDNNINGKVPVVYSSELPIKVKNRTPGSMILVPATAGILCASYIINNILKLSVDK